MQVMETRSREIGPSSTSVRRKKCVECGMTYSTAEVPLAVALDVWEADE